MKKTKKLVLAKETLKNLSAKDMKGMAGGQLNTETACASFGYCASLGYCPTEGTDCNSYADFCLTYAFGNC